MKKKIPLILALVCAIACAFGLAACGGNGKIKLSTAKFTDNGIASINIAGIPNGTSTTEDYDNDKPITRQSGCIYYHDGGEDYVAEWDKGKWDACVQVQIHFGYKIGTLKIEVGEKEYDLTKPDMFDKAILKGFYGFDAGEQDYYAYIGEPISSDTQIKLKGSTEVTTFTLQMSLANYDDYKDKQECQALRFTALVGEWTPFNSEPTNLVPFEYNSKTEFTATEFIEAMTNTQFSYYEKVKVSVISFPADKELYGFLKNFPFLDGGLDYIDFNCGNHDMYDMVIDYSVFADV